MIPYQNTVTDRLNETVIEAVVNLLKRDATKPAYYTRNSLLSPIKIKVTVQKCKRFVQTKLSNCQNTFSI
jgi:hypothetical protein